jgi:hypothetical protein
LLGLRVVLESLPVGCVDVAGQHGLGFFAGWLLARVLAVVSLPVVVLNRPVVKASHHVLL